MNFDDLDDRYKSQVTKEYYAKSPFASIEKLKNGAFLVVNLVNGCEFHPADTWQKAKAAREEIVSHYKYL